MLTFAAEGAVEGVFRIPAAQLRHTSIPFGRNTRHARPIGCHPRPAGSNAAIRLSAKMCRDAFGLSTYNPGKHNTLLTAELEKETIPLAPILDRPRSHV